MDEHGQIRIKLQPPAMEMGFKASFYYKNRLIGVDLGQRFNDEETALEKWIIEDLFTCVAGESMDGSIGIIGTGGNFNNIEDQSEEINMLINCLSVCDLKGISELIHVPVEISPRLKQKIDNGAFVQ